MQGSQLELDLQSAIADPPMANLEQLWQSLVEWIEPLPQEQQLRVAGDAIFQIAEVVCGRAQQILEGLERFYQGVEVGLESCISREFLEPFIRQSLSLNLDPLVVPPTSRYREIAIQSVVAECSKESLLEVLEGEPEKEEGLAIAHDEPIGE